MAVVVCQCADVRVLLLISVMSMDVSGNAIVFVSQTEHWNIGLLVMVELFIWTTGLLLGYVVHVNDCLEPDGPSAGNGTMTGEWKWSMLSPLTLLHQQKCYTCSLPAWRILALIQRRFFITNNITQWHIFNTLRYPLINVSLLLQQHSSMSWWCMFQWNWSS